MITDQTTKPMTASSNSRMAPSTSPTAATMPTMIKMIMVKNFFIRFYSGKTSIHRPGKILEMLSSYIALHTTAGI